MTELFQNISAIEWLILTLGGFLFGVFFTVTHFWALKHYVFKQKNLKTAVFVLTFFRLLIFGIVLWGIIQIHKSVLEVLIFFFCFMVGRWMTLIKTKRLLDNGKSL